jgi:hypothetical protein
MKTDWIAAFAGIAAALLVSAAPRAQTIAYKAPANSNAALRFLEKRQLTELVPAYKAKFDECDAKDTFGGQPLPHNDKCSGDKNRVKYLARVDGAANAVLYQSKMSLDLDGGYIACVMKMGASNQCQTTFAYDESLSRDYDNDVKTYGGERKIPDAKLTRYFNELFVQSDFVPYIVLPGNDEGEFSSLTGAKTGDLGVVVYNNIVVPVFVADRGPFFRLGEASARVFKAVGKTGCNAWLASAPRYCVHELGSSVDNDVTTIVFPGTRFAKGVLTPANVNSRVGLEAIRLYNDFSNPKAR